LTRASINLESLAECTIVVVCTYNEIENLPTLIDEIQVALPKVSVLVVDDNSPDGTGKWSLEKQADNLDLHVLIREGKLGLGSATVAGFRFAIEHHFDFAITMDADFSHHPDHLPVLLSQMDDEGVDVSIGSRYVSGGKIIGWPWHRRLISRWLNRVARVALGIKAKDCSGAFRCYRLSTLKRLDLDQIRSSGYSYLEEILWWLKRSDARMVEVPITFRDRVLGETKINFREALGALRVILAMGLRNWFGRR
jgi:dolichol-phosphate mannosyltransferase